MRVQALWEEDPPRLPTPSRECFDKCKINIQAFQETRQPVITSAQVNGPGLTSDRFVQTYLDSTYLQYIKTSIPRLTIC